MLNPTLLARRAFLRDLLGATAAVGLEPRFFPQSLAAQELPADVGPRAKVVTGIRLQEQTYRKNAVIRGQVTLNSPRTDLPVEVLWTDSYGRVAARSRALPAHSFNNVAEFSFPLDHPLTYLNTVEVQVEGVTQIEHARFLVTPGPDPWDDYHVINYTFYPQGYYDRLREAGVDAVIAYRDKAYNAFLENNFRFYVEEMIWEYLATYHKNFNLWKDLVRRFMENRNDWRVFTRDPCLNDPETLEHAKQVLAREVNQYKDLGPLFYDLSDELGVGDQIAASDLCHSRHCIRAFAEYLKRSYDSMHENRKEWDVDFYHWDDEQIDLGAEINWDDLMIHETTTDRAMDRILISHLSRQYGTVDAFNKAWGVSFPFPPMPSQYTVMDWTAVVAPLADTRPLATLDEKSLSGLFGSLEAANTRWGLKGGWTTDQKPTKFKSWTEVIAYIQRLEQAQAKIDDTEGWNLAAWCDFRNFMDQTFANFVRRTGDYCKSLDPHARIGTEGGQSPWAFGWYNYENICNTVDVIEPYNIGNNVEIIRGLGNHRVIQLNTYGFQFRPGTTEGDLSADDRLAQKQATRKVWWQLFHESRAAIIWDYTERDFRFVDENRNLTPAALTFRDTFREIRSGIAKLIIHAQRQNDGIAIHYSHPSVQVHWMIENLKKRKRWPVDEVKYDRSHFNGVRNSTTKIIEDLNLQYEFLGSRQIVDGALDAGKFKVLFLPQSIAMSSDEAGRVREFVESGGTVIADCRCATMNERGRDLGQGQLDDLFGISREGKRRTPAGTVRGVADFDNIHLKGKPLGLAAADSAIRARGATALAQQEDVPAALVRKVGKGLAIYLNLDLFPYQHWRVRPGPEAALRELLGEILAAAGVEPRVRVLDAAGKQVPAVEVASYRLGLQTIVAVFRNPQLDPGGWADGPRVPERGWGEGIDNSALEKPVDVVIQFPSSFHVYDVRAAKALGPVSSLTTTLDPWVPLVLTLSPTAVGGLKLSSPSRAERGRPAQLEITLDDSPAGVQPRIVRLDVYAPDGSLKEAYSANSAIDGQTATLTIPFAWNDASGAWKIKARDMATGVFAEASIQLG